jgi:hypothetical protein
MPSRPRSTHSSGSVLHVVVGSVPVTRFPGPLARRLNQICLTAMADALQPVELAPLQWSMLAYVCNEPELDQTALATRVAVDRANAGILIDQLGPVYIHRVQRTTATMLIIAAKQVSVFS